MAGWQRNVECRFYSQGRCRNGASCNFRHGSDEPEGMSSPHYAYMQGTGFPDPGFGGGFMGGAQFGQMFQMAYGSQDQGEEYMFRGMEEEGDGGGFTPPEICKFYQRGHCRKGDDCPYLHGDETMAMAEVEEMYFEVESADEESVEFGEGEGEGEYSGDLIIETVLHPNQSLLTEMIQTTPAKENQAGSFVDVVYCGEELASTNKRRTIDQDDFEVLYLIGTGLVGEVYLVRLRQTGDVYAMKVIPKQLVLAQDMCAHIRTERTVMGKVAHPYITKLFLAFQTDTKLVLILEYMCGGDLGFHLRRMCQLDEKTAQFYAAEIYLAVRHLHEHNIVHRDLKLSNVLLDKDGHARITDFGMAKQMKAEEAQNPRGLNTYCGTLAYMAPEIIKQEGHGISADWWSFGIIVYEMMAGFRPFDHVPSEEDTLRAITSVDVEMPPGVSKTTKDFLRRLLQRDPQKRLTAEQIGAHAFFRGIDWKKLSQRKVTPPFAPYIDSDDGDEFVGNFPSSLTNMTPPDPLACSTPEMSMPLFNFEQFTYENPALLRGGAGASASPPLRSASAGLDDSDDAYRRRSSTLERHIPDEGTFAMDL